MELTEIREEIDKIDEELVRLFCARMGLSAQVADYKKAHGLPVHVPAREEAILRAVAERSGAEYAEYTCRLYAAIFELSRCYQEKRWNDSGVNE